MSPRLDHDALFKQLLTAFLREFLELFCPDLVVLMSAEQLTFLDKEAFVDLIDPDRREADLVVKARLREQDAAFILHLEHQAQADAALDRRMFCYFARFYDRYAMPIYPIAVCSYASPRRPAPDQHLLALAQHTILDFRYQVVQLNKLDWRAYMQSTNPLAAALLVKMQVARRDRWRVKAASLRLLAGMPLTSERRRMLGQFVDLYTPLSAVEKAAVQQELATLPLPAQEALMEMRTSWEIEGHARGIREGRAEGIAEGIAEERRAIVLRLLLRKFGALPEQMHEAVIALDPDRLLALSEALLEFASLSDLTAWLKLSGGEAA